jgi:Sec-independent protein translocase protein TatA
MPSVPWLGVLVFVALALFCLRHLPAMGSAVSATREELKQTSAEETERTARLAQDQRQVSWPAGGISVPTGEEEADAGESQPMSTPTMRKERLQKEDGRYLITYRFLEADEEGNAPSMDDRQNEMVHRESASLGSDAL